MRTILLAFSIFLISCGGGGSDSDAPPAGDGTQLSGGCAVGRITNGTQCSLANGPVALIYVLNSNSQPVAVCTGAFLTSRKLLTAAHCFVDAGGTGAQIITGTTNARASRITTHPRYRPSDSISEFDVAIVELPQPQDVSTLPIFGSEGVGRGQRFTIIGFGNNENGDSAANVPPAEALNAASMVVQDTRRGAFLASYDTTGSSICSGDSGGPALRKNRDGLTGILGVAQAVLINPDDVRPDGSPICKNGTVAVFTDTQTGSALDFILSLVPEAGII